MTREKVKAMLIRNLCLALLALGIIIPGTAHAVCTGGVEGQLEYETVANVYRYCDGTDWVNISGGGGGASEIDDLSDAATSSSDNNIFLGHTGGSFGANDDYNVALGYSALDALNNSTALQNTAIGYSTLTANTSGGSNTALGATALNDNTTGSSNTAVGVGALYTNKAYGLNTAIGYWAMRFAGSSTTVTSSANTAVGYTAMQGSVTPASNTGLYNTAMGAAALANYSSGSNNVILGYAAGDLITTGSRNVIIGTITDPPTAGTDDYLNIGNAIYGDMGTTTAQSTSDAEIIIDGALVATDITAKSTLYLQDYGSGSHTGTATYTLAVDSSGNVIEEDAYDPGTWQDITSVHANIIEYSNWQCRIDSMRQVFFKGVLRASANIAAGTTIGTLPSDCWPASADIGYIALTGGSASTAFTRFFNITTGGSFVASNGMAMAAFYPVTTITYVQD